MFEEMKKIVSPAEMEEAVFTDDKQTREENIRVITDKLTEAFAENEEWLAILGEAVYQYEKKTVRKMILKDHKRPDGRAITQIRPLAAEVDIIPVYMVLLCSPVDRPRSVTYVLWHLCPSSRRSMAWMRTK